MTISETNPYNMGTVNVNGTIDKAFTVTNGGGQPATALGGSFDATGFSFKGGSYPGTGGNCGTSLSGGASCLIVITFRPTEAKSYSSVFNLSYHDGLRAQGEFKTLMGTGGTSINKDYYLSLFVDEIKDEEIRFGDLLLSRQMKKIRLIDESAGLVFFEYPDLSRPDVVEGLHAIWLEEDRDKDKVPDILLSLHKTDESGQLKGYIIRSGLTGKVIEKYELIDKKLID